MKNIGYKLLLIIILIVFSFIKVEAYTDLDCPAGYKLKTENICVKETDAILNNGVYSCESEKDLLRNNKCYRIFPLDKENNAINKVININNTENKNSNNNLENLCTSNNNIKKVVKLIGYVIVLCRICAPILIIGLGMLDFFRCIIANDDKAQSKSVQALIKRIIAGLAVFIAPSLVLAFINILKFTGGIENSSRFEACTKCILNVNNCDK